MISARRKRATWRWWHQRGKAVLLWGGTLLLGSASALVYADIPGKLPANTLYGNPTGAVATPKSLPLATPLLMSGGALGISTCTGLARGVVPTGGGGTTKFLREDCSWQISTGTATAADPTATAGIAAVNGVAATFMRSDAAPAVVAASTGTAGLAKLHNTPVAVGWPAALDPHGVVLANINQASTISAIVGSVDTPVGAAATLTIYKAGSGTACGSGTALHSGTFNANGTAATNQTLTVTSASLAAGDRICLQTTDSANWTAGVGIGTVTVFLAPS